MSKLDVKVFSSVTPFSKQWILGDEVYDLLYENQDFLSDGYGIVDLGSLEWETDGDLFYADLLGIYEPTATVVPDIHCLNFESVAFDVLPSATGNNLIGTNLETIFVQANDYESTEAFIAAMQGVYLIFKKGS